LTADPEQEIDENKVENIIWKSTVGWQKPSTTFLPAQAKGILKFLKTCFKIMLYNELDGFFVSSSI
jgi:hypothetical protein